LLYPTFSRFIKSFRSKVCFPESYVMNQWIFENRLILIGRQVAINISPGSVSVNLGLMNCMVSSIHI
jgi:hypothetical protein